MTISRAAIIALYLSLAGCAGSPSQPAPRSPYDVNSSAGVQNTTVQAPFRCAADGGYFEKQQLKNVGRSLSARITLTGTNAHTKWVPAAGLLFMLPGKQRYAGVQVFVLPDQPHELLIGFKTPETPDQPVPIAKARLNDPVEVQATLDEEGRLTVAAGGTSKTVRLKTAVVTGAVLMCSSGAFTFENLSAPLEQDRFRM